MAWPPWPGPHGLAPMAWPPWHGHVRVLVALQYPEHLNFQSNVVIKSYRYID